MRNEEWRCGCLRNRTNKNFHIIQLAPDMLLGDSKLQYHNFQIIRLRSNLSAIPHSSFLIPHSPFLIASSVYLGTIALASALTHSSA